MNTYRIFTIAGDAAVPGAKVETLTLKGAGTSIPAVIIGEEGTGRERGVIPVAGFETKKKPCPFRGADWGNSRQWNGSGDRCWHCGTHTIYNPVAHHPDEGDVQEDARLFSARIGETRSGKPRLINSTSVPTTDAAIIILATGIGYRGGNSHTGDYVGWECSSCKTSGKGDVPETCPQCGQDDRGEGYWRSIKPVFLPMPGTVLSRGRIADGAAGRMGSGEQLVILLPAGQVVRIKTFSDGRRPPSIHYARFDGQNVVVLSAEERDAADIF